MKNLLKSGIIGSGNGNSPDGSTIPVVSQMIPQQTINPMMNQHEYYDTGLIGMQDFAAISQNGLQGGMHPFMGTTGMYHSHQNYMPMSLQNYAHSYYPQQYMYMTNHPGFISFKQRKLNLGDVSMDPSLAQGNQLYTGPSMDGSMFLAPNPDLAYDSNANGVVIPSSSAFVSHDGLTYCEPIQPNETPEMRKRRLARERQRRCRAKQNPLEKSLKRERDRNRHKNKRMVDFRSQSSGFSAVSPVLQQPQAYPTVGLIGDLKVVTKKIEVAEKFNNEMSLKRKPGSPIIEPHHIPVQSPSAFYSEMSNRVNMHGFEVDSAVDLQLRYSPSSRNLSGTPDISESVAMNKKPKKIKKPIIQPPITTFSTENVLNYLDNQIGFSMSSIENHSRSWANQSPTTISSLHHSLENKLD